jgi:hypothetical protein
VYQLAPSPELRAAADSCIYVRFEHVCMQTHTMCICIHIHTRIYMYGILTV